LNVISDIYASIYNFNLTFEGRLFEGYIKQKSNLAFQQTKANDVANAQLLLTVILAAGTVALALIELLKWYSGD
jgi:hypothetical protein